MYGECRARCGFGEGKGNSFLFLRHSRCCWDGGTGRTNLCWRQIFSSWRGRACRSILQLWRIGTGCSCRRLLLTRCWMSHRVDVPVEVWLVGRE